MKRIAIFILLLSATRANAQMAAAQKVMWNWDSVSTFKSPSLAVWDLLKVTDKWNEISNGFVSSVTVTGNQSNQVRVLKFADGRERNDEVAQLQPEYKLLVIKLSAPFPEGIEEGRMAFFTKVKEGGGTELRITILVNGEKKAKAKLVEELRQEAVAYAAGLKAKLAE